jgi:hypothetical protein
MEYPTRFEETRSDQPFVISRWHQWVFREHSAIVYTNQFDSLEPIRMQTKQPSKTAVGSKRKWLAAVYYWKEKKTSRKISLTVELGKLLLVGAIPVSLDFESRRALCPYFVPVLKWCQFYERRGRGSNGHSLTDHLLYTHANKYIYIYIYIYI